MPWINLTQEEASILECALDEAWRNASSDAHNDVDGAEETVKEYADLMEIISSQVDPKGGPQQNPFSIIRKVAEENDWEEGDSDGNRIWSIAEKNCPVQP